MQLNKSKTKGNILVGDRHKQVMAGEFLGQQELTANS